MQALIRFLGPVQGSIQGYLNLAELNRAMLASLGASSVMALLTNILVAVSADASHIFSPGALSLATFAIGLIVDAMRRLDHQSPPSPPAVS